MLQIKVGKVVSNKMQKTAVVEIQSIYKHPLYKKPMKRTTKIKTHDDLGVKIGQKVKICQTRPIAKDVHFKIMEVIK